MMERLLERARAIGARRVAVLAALIEHAARDELPAEVEVEPVAGGIVLAGRRLGRRMLDDARLRGIGLLVKALLR